MTLPVISVPKFELTLPSTGKKYKYRPFLVKEEKILLIALEGDNSREILSAVKDLVSACVEKIKIEDLTIFDLEYVFLRLREKSIGDIIKINLRHKNSSECENVQEVEVNLNEVGVIFNDKNEKKIQLTDNVGMVLKYPSITIMDKISDDSNESDYAMEILENCIDYIYDADKIYPSKDYKKEEIHQFIDSLSHQHMEKIDNFFTTLPKLEHKVTWKCEKCGKEETMTLSGLSDFFI